MENLLILKDGIKHMENELEREFGVFSLEPCPQRCSREVRSGQGHRTPWPEWPLPTVGSLLLPGFISGIFQPFPSKEHFLPAFP